MRTYPRNCCNYINRLRTLLAIDVKMGHKSDEFRTHSVCQNVTFGQLA